MSKTIYVANAVHPNMNYDRSSKSVIREKFPEIYRLFLDYTEANHEIKVHFQLPGQTLNSLRICAPDVLERIAALHRDGRVRYMGTYFSEPVGMCIDGMSALDSAMLGTTITREELGEPEGFFLQEVAYFPQVPYIVNRLGVQWTVLFDWDDEFFFPYALVGLDGSTCVGVPTIGAERLVEISSDSIPDNALIMLHNDLEIPGTVKLTDRFRERLYANGVEAKWVFVSDYLRVHGLKGTKRPGPSTNKKEDSADSPSFSRWVSKPIDIVTHHATLSAMESYRRSMAICLNPEFPEPVLSNRTTHPRSYVTWDVESVNDYPWVAPKYLASNGSTHPLEAVKHLIAWSTNSDARGWYPLFERTVERRDGFAEASRIADTYARRALASDPNRHGGPGFWAINNYPLSGSIERFVAEEPVNLLSPDRTVQVVSIRPVPEGFEHLVRIDLPPYSVAPAVLRRSPTAALSAPTSGTEVSKGGTTISHTGTGVDVTIRTGGASATLSLDPFKVLIQRFDAVLRAPRPEGGVRVRAFEDDLPTLVVEQQIDWHVHFHSEYILDGANVLATWKFYFTAPTLVDAHLPQTLDERDFKPGGIKARLSTGVVGRVLYDCPFGEVEHKTRTDGYIAALTHAFLESDRGGFLVASRTGSQSFHVSGKDGELALCLGRSTTSGGRRKLSFRVGAGVLDVEAEQEWYKEPFVGEYVHRFVVRPFLGSAVENLIPVWGRMLATGCPMLNSVDAGGTPVRTLYELTPSNVLFSGAIRKERKIVLNEVCGTETDFTFRVGPRQLTGHIPAFGILEIPWRAT